MTFARIRSSWLLIGSAALMLLLALAAVQQYRWINRVSEADRRQRREYMEATLRSTSNDFRETIHELLPTFRPSPAIPLKMILETYLAGRAVQWRETSDRPQLLGSVSFAAENPNGVVFKRLRLGETQFTEQSWPEDLTLYRTILEKHLRMPGGEPPLFPNGFAFELSEGRPVIIFPLVTNAEPPPPTPPSPPGENDRPTSQSLPPLPRHAPEEFSAEQNQPTEPGELLQMLRPAPPERMIHLPELRGWCFLELDTDYLEKHLLPELIERHFSREALSDYKVAVVTGEPLRIIYSSDPTLTTGSLSFVDAGILLFDPHMQQGRPAHPPPPPPPQQHHGNSPPQERHPGPPPPAGPPPFVSGAEGEQPPPIGPLQPINAETDAAAWRLVLKNRAGSLESLVNMERRRNLALSFGVLLLLVGSTFMLMLATQRARSLAKQQMEFVAGVSHELRTPLTVIQSTSYNLSKGVIQDPERVRKYGDVIQGEARRLINQVEQMLSFAGIQSGRKLYDLRPLDVAKVIDRALNEYTPAFDEGGWQIEKHVSKDLPQVLADAQSLESAIKNLLENGLKYASQGKWLCVGARVEKNGKGTAEVQIMVADHGPGIAPAELPHIFEPFYRGQAVLASSTSGAGLGLSLVERHLRAHRGRVTAQSSPKDGTVFTLHLPALEQSESIDE
jgi:two-component system sensor histidine kinase SenX3